MNKNKTANRNPANYHLYHALMEALIADEDAMDKKVKYGLKDHKRKHDSDDDEDVDDDKGPSAGSNQGKSAKRRKYDSSASGSAQPPLKDDEQNVVIDSSMQSSELESGHSEHSSDDISKQDEGHVLDLEVTDNAYIPKVKAATWFKPIQEDERPATPEPEWTIPPNDFPEPENNWANAYATSYQVPAENKLQRNTYDIGSFIKWFCRQTGKKKLCKADLEGPTFNLVKAFYKNSVFLQFKMDECHKLLTNKIDLVNPEGHQILRDINEPLPLGGPPGQLKDARYLDFGLKELVPSLWVESERDYDISAAYGITHWLDHKMNLHQQHSEPSDREAVRSQMRILSMIRVKTFEKYGYNYLREIILRRADYKEYKISEKDFKNLYPNGFEDLVAVDGYAMRFSAHQEKGEGEGADTEKEIIRIKREQGEKKQESTYTIRSTDKVALEEFDLKSALFKHMNKNKTANRNLANYHLYHALMEALIADEDAMDKEVKDGLKDHKRKHDSDDDEDVDDDKGPSVGSNQGKSAGSKDGLIPTPDVTVDEATSPCSLSSLGAAASISLYVRFESVIDEDS
ncbi:hypothetical protein Tco_0750287 [Tanacetum coccineum]|uniref:Uncharacterized protein n=1 Tax=Tanacetum coccineum TaxID=301880 RepID=A0ABQ4Z3F7_9ASTR